MTPDGSNAIRLNIDSDFREALDTDGDNIHDAQDIDDDNDGILDWVEGLTRNGNSNSGDNGSTIPWLGDTTSNVSITTSAGNATNNIGASFTLPNGQPVAFSGPGWAVANDRSFTFTFDTAVPADEIGFFINDVNPVANPVWRLSVNGGATLADFETATVGTGTNLTYRESDGFIFRGASGSPQSGLIVGSSRNLVSSFSITAIGNVGAFDLIGYGLVSFSTNNADGIDNGIYGLDSDLDSIADHLDICLLYTSPSPRDGLLSRMPSSA